VEVGGKMATFLKKKKKCDLVICISHLGFNIGGDDDVKLVEGTRNIDLVLGGHFHTYLKHLEYRKNLDGKDVGIDQNGKHGIFVGKLVLDLTRSKK
jgi:5'-nucleotidase